MGTLRFSSSLRSIRLSGQIRLSTLISSENRALQKKRPRFRSCIQYRRSTSTAANAASVQSSNSYPSDFAQSSNAQHNASEKSSIFAHPTWHKHSEGVLSIDPNQSQPNTTNVISPLSGNNIPKKSPAFEPEDGSLDENLDSLRLENLLHAYRRYGHLHASINPLEINMLANQISRKFDLRHHGFADEDLDRDFALGPEVLSGFITNQRKTMKLRDIITACQSVYTDTLGAEYMHLEDEARRAWIQQRLENDQTRLISRKDKEHILDELLHATLFERFEAAKFPNDKRYGLDGAESLAPAITTIIDCSADRHGVQDIIVGSCHRGRLTMLPCVYGKSPQAIFAEFRGATASRLLPGMAGDVKYHLGHDGIRTTKKGRKVRLSLLPNPSHLEAIDPVATGKAYATQQQFSKSDKNVMCLALHGDAAFAGQGVAYETLGLSRLPAYNIGGTIRVMVNNQIGFTTDVKSSRSTTYCTDLAKHVDAPILHVNADDVETVVTACQIAADWRAKFHSDIFIDLLCYRRFGHNELDQPNLTQPEMYATIRDQTPTLEKYVQKLINEGSFTHQEIEKKKTEVLARFNEDYRASKSYEPQLYDHPASWKNTQTPERLCSDTKTPISTGVSEQDLRSIGDKLTTLPTNFNPHRNLQRVIETRRKGFDDGIIDWSTAEALAFGTLCTEKNLVRLTGQDVQRGTFSQRHAVWHDQKSFATTTPLNNLSGDQSPFVVANSPLGEYGALGFEYGYTLANPNALVMWEAQFGDFANTAQVIIDNFISSAESKWMQRSGLVMSLPHGYDGQGAEHSSARLERFLNLCSEEGRKWPTRLDRQHQDCNMQIVYPTTPANYFHVLRRQIHREYRKPLIIFFSKSLLRHALNRSEITEFVGNSAFQRVVGDIHENKSVSQPDSITRVLLCTGQVYAALRQYRETHNFKNVVIIRVEELHPFPWSQVRDNLDIYANAREIVWVQEEPYNGGAWSYVRDRLDSVLVQTKFHQGKRISYVGRATSPVTATGVKKAHEAEVTQLLADAFSTCE